MDELQVQQNPIAKDLDRQRDLVMQGLMGLFSNPMLDRLRSGESWNQPPITPETKPGYLGPSASPTQDMIVGGLIAPLNFLGGPESGLAKLLVGGGAKGILAHALPGASKSIAEIVAENAPNLTKAVEKHLAFAPMTAEELTAKMGPKAAPTMFPETKGGGWGEFNSPQDAAEHMYLLAEEGNHSAYDTLNDQMPKEFGDATHTILADMFKKNPIDYGHSISMPPVKSAPTFTKAGTNKLPDLSDSGINAALEKDPGASIFDIAQSKIKGWKDKTTSVLENADLKQSRAQAEKSMRDKTFQAQTQYEYPTLASPEQENIYTGLGFNQPAYHGTRARKKFEGFKLPEDEIGVHMGTRRASGSFVPDEFSDPDTGYAEHGRVYPLVTKAQNPLALPDLGTWYSHQMKDALKNYTTIPIAEINAAKSIQDVRDLIHKHGYDSIAYINQAEDPGSVSFIKMKPEEIRSPFAKFQNLDINHLLAGLAGFGVVAPALTGGQDAR